MVGCESFGSKNLELPSEYHISQLLNTWGSFKNKGRIVLLMSIEAAEININV